jgi:hypothetical protein
MLDVAQVIEDIVFASEPGLRKRLSQTMNIATFPRIIIMQWAGKHQRYSTIS